MARYGDQSSSLIGFKYNLTFPLGFGTSENCCTIPADSSTVSDFDDILADVVTSISSLNGFYI